MNNLKKSAYQPNLGSLRADLHQLLCVFEASESIHRKIQEEPDYSKKHLLFEQLENDAITKLLLSTAITLRILDDRENGILEMFSMYCGLIQEKSNNLQESKGVTIRIACNKIVHATEIAMVRNNVSSEIRYLFPEIDLSGTERNKKWDVTINIYEYVREGIRGIGNLK